jgi:hypothetical protein
MVPGYLVRVLRVTVNCSALGQVTLFLDSEGVGLFSFRYIYMAFSPSQVIEPASTVKTVKE